MSYFSIRRSLLLFYLLKGEKQFSQLQTEQIKTGTQRETEQMDTPSLPIKHKLLKNSDFDKKAAQKESDKMQNYNILLKEIKKFVDPSNGLFNDADFLSYIKKNLPSGNGWFKKLIDDMYKDIVPNIERILNDISKNPEEKRKEILGELENVDVNADLEKSQFRDYKDKKSKGGQKRLRRRSKQKEKKKLRRRSKQAKPTKISRTRRDRKSKY